MKQICLNCGSSPGFDPIYIAMAQRLGQALAARNYELVYGGSEVGLMGEVANTVLKAGGVVIGVIPKSFAHKVSHPGLTELHVVDSMHERKTLMFNLSDSFIALPGGLGTLEEITEILTWGQLGLHSKPCGLINVDGYFDPLLSFLEQAVSKGFMRTEHKEMLHVSDTPEDLLVRFETYQAPTIEKWVGVKIRT
ncbi:MAG: TIGR00730 family Rossman fold protein [Thermodesulfobacteriota bacterium]